MIEYTINGHREWMPDEELREVERSGCSTWQDYANAPGEWPAPTVAVCPLMAARPGAVEPGDRPVGVSAPIVTMRVDTWRESVRPFTWEEKTFMLRARDIRSSSVAMIMGRSPDGVRKFRKRNHVKPITHRGYDYEEQYIAQGRVMWEEINRGTQAKTKQPWQ